MLTCVIIQCFILFPEEAYSSSITMAEQQQQFYLLLGNLMSPDNAIRKQSEVRITPATGIRGCDCGSWGL
uniref:Secreted protein n=1 Tax=Astyanax mexicanus TaxID=7994 RepID=A0A8B9GQE4_ASTMX